MKFEVLEIIFFTSILSISIPLFLVLLKFKRQPNEFKWLAAFLSIYMLAEIVGRILYMIGINPNISGGIYWILSCSLISAFFYYSIEWKSLKFFLLIINVFYFLFSLSNFLFIQKLSHNSYSQTLESFIILTFSILFLYKLIKELPTQQISKLPLFWVISGFFFSYAGKLVIYGVSHYLIHTLEDNLIVIWAFHNFLTIVGNILITVGVLLQYRRLNGKHAY